MPDIINAVLSFQPLPGLQALWSAFWALHSIIEKSKHCKEQLFAMIYSVAELLATLQRVTGPQGDISLDSKFNEVKDIESLLEEITTWVEKQSKENFLKSLYHTDDRVSSLDIFHKRLLLAIERCHLVTLDSVSKCQQRFEDARMKDQKDLEVYLIAIQRDQNELARVLESQHASVVSMMLSIQQALQTAKTTDPVQHQFLQNSLNYLRRTSGKTLTVEPWIVSSFDVDFGDVIGGGGFGKVYKGFWNETPVALKVLTQDGIAPREAAIKREIKIWANLRHSNILQFMSANVVDEPPFIVMPYMRHGNAKDYILDHPEFNRPQMLLHVARGLAYLHRESVIHGDIKAWPISFSWWTNILIDNGFNAVLADFGLSQLKTDVSTRVRSKLTEDGSTTNFGSYYWMAPERLTGGQMLFASDLYSFGMTMYEIFTCEIPLGSYPLVDYVDAVVKQNLRPRRPVSQGRFAIEMSDELWSICTQCWLPEPSHRPNAASVCKELSTFDIIPDISPISPSGLLNMTGLSPLIDQYSGDTLGTSSASDMPLNGSSSPDPSRSPNKYDIPLVLHQRTPSDSTCTLSSFTHGSLVTTSRTWPHTKSEGSISASPSSSAPCTDDRTSSPTDPAYSPARHPPQPLVPHRRTESRTTSAPSFPTPSSLQDLQKLAEDVSLAEAYKARGQHNEAVVVLENVVDGRIAALGQDHLDTFLARSALARSYASAGRLKDARSLGKTLVKEKSLGLDTEHHLAHTRVMADLMSVYHDLKQFNEAIDIGIKAVKSQTALTNKDDHQRLAYILELGSVYRSMGLYEDAEKFEKHVMDKKKKLFGDSHLETVDAQARLALTYAKQPSRLDKAAALQSHVLDMRAHLQGAEHPDKIDAMSALAATLYNQDKFEEALVLETKVVEYCERMYGTLDPATILAKDKMARTQMHLGEVWRVIKMRAGRLLRKGSSS